MSVASTRLLLALLLVACGARTGLAPAADPDAGASPRDAGLRDAGLRDAGARDAGLRDAGTPDAGPAPCTGRVIEEPFEVHRHTVGVYERPIVVRRGDLWDLLVTYVDPEGRVEIYVTQLQTDPPLGWPPVRLDPIPAAGTASAASFGGRLVTCVPDLDAHVYLRHYVPDPTYPVGLSEVFGVYDGCSGSAATDTSMIVGLTRGGGELPYVMTFAPGGGLAAHRVLSDPTRRAALGVGTVGERLVWASSTDEFGQIEVGWIDGTMEQSFLLGGFGRADGVAPVLAAWPLVAGALAILGGSGFAPHFVVVDASGATLVDAGRVPGRMWDRPAPALAATRDGLLLAQLDFGDLDPRGGLLSLSFIDATGSARPLPIPTFGVRRPTDGSGAEVSAASDGTTSVVLYTGDEDGQPVARAMILSCD
ncbi:MAG: hypothetical protein H6719_29925 [Sandaracinaceae bacterium]|nr:hypothetical protein [Sandaracinaceae bacterium]